jgi:chromosome segregation ATPase
MRRQIQITNEDLERQMEKLSNNTREIQNEKDKLESELVTMKLEQKLLTSKNTSHSHDMQDMRSKVTKLVEERDFYDKKCKELEKGLKLNADQEISQLNQALEVLNEENNILRQRNMKLEGDVGGLLNVKTDLEAKVRNGNFGAENGGFSPEVSHSEEPIRQKLPEVSVNV